jgi:hypothetical protein
MVMIFALIDTQRAAESVTLAQRRDCHLNGGSGLDHVEQDGA